MYKQGKCYKCGGFLAVNEAEDATVCLFCNQPIVTEKAIRCFEENSAQAPAAPEKPVVADSDFVVAGGVLIRYDGFTKTDIRIPESVKAIYPLAFADCTALESVSFVGKTELYKGSNPYKHGNNVATFFNCPKLLTVDFRNLQKHYWAFPAYMKAQEPEFIAHGRCDTAAANSSAPQPRSVRSAKPRRITERSDSGAAAPDTTG